MFFRKNFLFYLPEIDMYVIIKAKDLLCAVNKLYKNYKQNKEYLKNYKIVSYYKTIK